MRSDKLMKPSRVASALDCGVTQAKFKMKNDLGGWFEPGIGWRCTERALNAFIAAKAKGAQCRENFPSTHDQAKAGDTGSATSERQTDSAISERSTSETTEPEKASERRSPPTGTSKHAQHLVSLINNDPHGRSYQRSLRSRKRKESPT